MDRSKLPACGRCSKQVTQTYLDFVKDAPLISVPIIGLTQVSKTTFIQALTLALSEIGGKAGMPEIGFRPCNDVTMRWYQDIRVRAAQGRPPDPTSQLHEEEIYLFTASGIPRWGSRTVAFRDVRGETLKDYHFPPLQAEFCKRTKCALIAISISDLEKQPGNFIDQMLSSYVYTLRENKVKVNDGRKVVIMLTKADQLHDKLPPRLWDFLNNDPVRRAWDDDPIVAVDLSTPAGMQEYFESLQKASTAIAEWVRTLRQGVQLLNIAKQEGIDIAFTLSSPWGSEPELDEHTRKPINPYRVLDPFLWLLEFHSRVAP